MSDDTINRQDAIDAIERLILPQVKGETAAEEINRVAWRCAINCAEEMIVHLPSAERRGRWEHYEHREPQYDIEGYKTWAEAYKCSNCGFIHTVIEDFGHYAFCPNCGADMREAKNGCDDCFIPMFYNLEDDDSICRDCGVGE